MKTPRSLLRGIKEVGFALKIRDFQTSGYFSKRSKLRGIRPVAIESYGYRKSRARVGVLDPDIQRKFPYSTFQAINIP
jgi:hypothetical protein